LLSRILAPLQREREGKVLAPSTSKTLLPFDAADYPGVRVGIIEGRSGAQGLVATLQEIFITFKKVLAPILVFIVGFFGIQLVVARGEEEEFKKVLNHFTLLLLGVGVVILAQFMSDTFTLYSSDKSTFLSGNQEILGTAKKLMAKTDIVIRFVRYLMGGIALFFVVKSGAIILFNPEEESVDKQKDIFAYGFVGLLLIMISEALVRTVFNVKSNENLLQGSDKPLSATPPLNDTHPHARVIRCIKRE